MYRRIIRNLVPNIKTKMKWTNPDETKTKELLLNYLSPGETTYDDVCRFFDSQNVKYRYFSPASEYYPSEKSYTWAKEEFDSVLLCAMRGPRLWEGLLPNGSMYLISLHFKDNTLVELNMFLDELMM